jgi:hypothetical protein
MAVSRLAPILGIGADETDDAADAAGNPDLPEETLTPASRTIGCARVFACPRLDLPVGADAGALASSAKACRSGTLVDSYESDDPGAQFTSSSGQGRVTPWIWPSGMPPCSPTTCRTSF